MFEKTQTTTQDGHTPVAPDEPVLLPFKAGRVLWAKLFNDVHLADQPQFVVLFQRGRALEVAEPDEEPCANTDALTDPSFHQAVIVPLVERVKDLYGTEAHMLITYAGRVWVCDEQDAVQCLTLNEPPRDPDEIRIEVHPFISRSWDLASAFAQTRHERVKFFGLIVFVCAFVLLVSSGLVWMFAVYQLGRATDAVIASLNIINPPLWVSMLFALTLSAIEILGIIFRPMRPYAFVVALADLTLHAWYGHKIGMQQMDAQTIVAIWTLGFALLSVVPEVATIYFGGITFYLAPLAGIWLPRRLGSMLSGVSRAWRKHDYDVSQIEGTGTYTVIDGRTTRGTESVRYLPRN